MIGQLNLTLWAWIESFRSLRRGRVWTPFLVMLLLQAAGLLLVTEFYRPVFSWFLAPLLVSAAGPQVLHYPHFFLALPQVFSRVNVALDLLAGSVLYGAAGWILWDLALGGNGRGAWRRARGRWFALLLLRLPISLLPFVFYLVAPRLFSADQLTEPNTIRLLRYGGFLFGVIVESLFVYGPLAVLVQEKPFIPALRETLRVAFKVPLATFLIVFVPNTVHLPLAAALRRGESIILKLTPETVGWLVFLSVLVYLAATYLSLASAVRVFGARAGGGEGGR